MLRKTIHALAFALAGFSGVPAFAGALQITDVDPIAVVTVPDAWTTAKIKRGVEIRTPDEEIYLWFELIAPAELDTLQKEHNVYFEKEGVTITGASDTVKQEVKGKAWSFTELKAKSKDGESLIRYIAINPNVASGKIIMMTYWASLEGHKTHDAAMSAIIDSIAYK
ncbi:hypothetical protein [Bosea sp. (in: a-proteobacteria)]|jgi:hypothetical protein|uniref:hypothetical protein n=1 Tax=Bosea sp. (in: a-proteobacteria) TaxID=1871050 RepID=UPI002DDC9773|nr:hypothetical protein [Bosea sp. (in: a-proteobacteria)]HEV2511688.1 hypothetical protein [Bosea sp. (in: a-proteobacteria)]